MKLLQRRVQKGAALLDEHGPNAWWEQIDEGKLNMSSSLCCVLGQMDSERTYFDALESLGINKRIGYTSVTHGFSLEWKPGNPIPMWDRWHELRGLWLEEIKRRRLMPVVEREPVLSAP